MNKENEANTEIFANPIYPDLAAFNCGLKDLVEAFDITLPGLLYRIKHEAEFRENFPLKKRDDHGLVEWGIIGDLEPILCYCRGLASLLLDKFYEKPTAIGLPIFFNLVEVGGIIESVVSEYDVKIKAETKDLSKMNYGYWFQVIAVYCDNLVSQKERLTSASKIINAFIEKEAIARPDIKKPTRPPLGPIAQLIYWKLKDLPETKAMTAPEICDWLSRKHSTILSESSIYKEYKKQLEPWGLYHEKRIGFCIREK